jgi:hypothetical protein
LAAAVVLRGGAASSELELRRFLAAFLPVQGSAPDPIR